MDMCRCHACVIMYAGRVADLGGNVTRVGRVCFPPCRQAGDEPHEPGDSGARPGRAPSTREVEDGGYTCNVHQEKHQHLGHHRHNGHEVAVEKEGADVRCGAGF